MASIAASISSSSLLDEEEETTSTRSGEGAEEEEKELRPPPPKQQALAAAAAASPRTPLPPLRPPLLPLPAAAASASGSRTPARGGTAASAIGFFFSREASLVPKNCPSEFGDQSLRSDFNAQKDEDGLEKEELLKLAPRQRKSSESHDIAVCSGNRNS